MTAKRVCTWCPTPLPADAQLLCGACAEKEAMLKEGLTNVPDRLTREDFERFLWKLAVYAIKGMRPRWTLEHVRNSLALPIVEGLPMNYISFIKGVVREKGEPAEEPVYTVKAPIPKMVLFKTVERLGIWKPVDKDKEEPDNFTGV